MKSLADQECQSFPGSQLGLLPRKGCSSSSLTWTLASGAWHTQYRRSCKLFINNFISNMCPFWFWRIMSSTNQRQNWFGNLPPDFFVVDTLTPCPSSSLAAESMAQGEHKLAPYSKTARNTVNKELVNQPLREAEGYEHTDKYKTSHWDFTNFFFPASMIKNYFDIRVLMFPPPCSPTEMKNSKNASCFSCFLINI